MPIVLGIVFCAVAFVIAVKHIRPLWVLVPVIALACFGGALVSLIGGAGAILGFVVYIAACFIAVGHTKPLWAYFAVLMLSYFGGALMV